MRVISSVVTMLLLSSLTGFADSETVNLKKGDRIVFFGDSITAQGGNPGGYVSLIKNSINTAHPDWGVEIVNAGVSGNHVRELQARLQADVLDKKPSLVFIYIGVNDVGHLRVKRRTGTTKDEFKAGLKEIIGKIKAAGTKVVLCTPSVIGEKKDGTNTDDKTMEEYCDISRSVAKDTKVLLVDIRKAFIEHLKANNPENKDKGILTVDTVHLSPAGNKLVAEQMLKVLDVKLAEPEAAPAKK